MTAATPHTQSQGMKRLGQVAQAKEAYARAVGLSEDAAVREFLAGQA